MRDSDPGEGDSACAPGCCVPVCARVSPGRGRIGVRAGAQGVVSDWSSAARRRPRALVWLRIVLAGGGGFSCVPTALRMIRLSGVTSAWQSPTREGLVASVALMLKPQQGSVQWPARSPRGVGVPGLWSLL